MIIIRCHDDHDSTTYYSGNVWDSLQLVTTTDYTVAYN